VPETETLPVQDTQPFGLFGLLGLFAQELWQFVWPLGSVKTPPLAAQQYWLAELRVLVPHVQGTWTFAPHWALHVTEGLLGLFGLFPWQLAVSVIAKTVKVLIPVTVTPEAVTAVTVITLGPTLPQVRPTPLEFWHWLVINL
jgi:hypothetical protein